MYLFLVSWNQEKTGLLMIDNGIGILKRAMIDLTLEGKLEKVYQKK